MSYGVSVIPFGILNDHVAYFYESLGDEQRKSAIHTVQPLIEDMNR